MKVVLILSILCAKPKYLTIYSVTKTTELEQSLLCYISIHYSYTKGKYILDFLQQNKI